jgi:hypothetical protein
MSPLILPARFNEKPRIITPRLVTPNSGLWMFGAGAVARNAVNGVMAAVDADRAKLIGTRYGQCVQVSSTTALNRVNLGIPNCAIFGSNDFTVIARAKLDATAGYTIAGRFHSTANPAASSWFLGAANGLNLSTNVTYISNGSTNVEVTSNALAKNTDAFWTWTLTRRGNIVYVRTYNEIGALVISGSAAFTGSVNNPAGNLGLGEIYLSSGYNASVTADYLYISNGVGHSDSELRRIAERPYQRLIAPQKRVLYFDAPSFPVLSSLTAGYITSSGGRLTAST